MPMRLFDILSQELAVPFGINEHLDQLDRIDEIADPANAYEYEKTTGTGKEGMEFYYDFTDDAGRKIRVRLFGAESRTIRNRRQAWVRWTEAAMGKGIARLELSFRGKIGPGKWIPKPVKGSPAGVANRTLATIVKAVDDYMNSEGTQAIVFAWPPARNANIITYFMMKPGQDSKIKDVFTATARRVAKAQGGYSLAAVTFTEKAPRALNDGFTIIAPTPWFEKEQDDNVKVTAA